MRKLMEVENAIAPYDMKIFQKKDATFEHYDLFGINT